MEEEREEDYTMSWVSRITPKILFGPKPESKQDVEYLKRFVGTIVNLLIPSATYTKISEFRSKRMMKRAVMTSQSYLGYYDIDEDAEEFPMHYISLPFDVDAIVATGRLKEDQMRKRADAYVQHARKIASAAKAGSIYIHSKTGFLTEAFIAFAVWGLTASKQEAPTDIRVWFSQTVNAPQSTINMNVFNEDEENLLLLECIWKEARKPASPFHKTK
jgi:hypothetical protein